MCDNNTKDIKFVYNGINDCRLYFNDYGDIMDLIQIFNQHEYDKTFITMGEIIEFVKGDKKALDSILSHPAEEYLTEYCELNVINLLSFYRQKNDAYKFLIPLPKFKHKSDYITENI